MNPKPYYLILTDNKVEKKAYLYRINNKQNAHYQDGKAGRTIRNKGGEVVAGNG